MYQHILIPTDGSELAQKAITNGLSLAQALRAKVTVLTVESPFHVMGTYRTHIRDMNTAMAEHAERAKAHSAKILSAAAESAQAVGVPCETVQAEQDHPYAAIISIAQERACDLIAMASHGRSGVSALVLGSETNKVLTHSTIPVLVYR